MADGDIVVVTGGSGFLGQHIVMMLQEKTSVSNIHVFDQHLFSKKLDYKDRVVVRSFTGDINDPKAVNLAFSGATAVIHTVGIVSVCTFPDREALKKLHVDGTNVVIKACIAQNVQRLIYTSTTYAVIGYDVIDNADESIPYPAKYLFGSYGETKARAEQLVNKANFNELKNGQKLSTISLRPPGLFGELDTTYVPMSFRAVRKTCGVFPRVGNGKAKMQQAYVGNVAWCHVLASQKLKESPNLGGQVFIVTS